MMKWKVVKNPRCVSADRSLDCLKEKTFPNGISDSNNNTHCKQDSNSPKENNKQQDAGFIRKPSLVASDCINWKGFLGLTRQRSEINLSNLGLMGNEQRRSRSEVRGISCDRLTIGYHTPNLPVVAGSNAKTPNPSPPSKSGCWLRGRKRERETRNAAKVSVEPPGKTVVTGCNSKRASSRPNESRTIADQIGDVKKSSTRLSSEGRKVKPNRKDSSDNIIEEDIIYSEIEHNSSTKLLKENQNVTKGPIKIGRKKGQAPKPNVILKESKCDVNLNPNGVEHTNCFVEKKTSPTIKPSKKLQNSNDRNQLDNRSMQNVKFNNAVNSETFLTVKNKISSVVAIAEVHKNNIYDYSITEKSNTDDEDNNNAISKKAPTEVSGIIQKKLTPQPEEIEPSEEKERIEEFQIEIPPFRIDTPDYSTLESEFEQNKNSRPTPDEIATNNLKNTSSVNNNSNSNYKISNNGASKVDPIYEGTISSILRGSSNDIRNCDPEQTSKKVVRFEKIDLIETYKKNKAERESDEDSVISISEQKPKATKLLDVNSNEISNPESRVETPEVSSQGLLEKHSSSSSECLSESSATSSIDTEIHQKSMRVNVLVKNPSTECLLTNCVVDSQVDESQTQLIVKKSFVLTIAKQEKGFKSLCANKKPDVISEVPNKNHKISVTFLCSDAVKESSHKGPPPLPFRTRSVSVPPQQQHATEVIAVMPPPLVRGRSRDRRSKERQHSKKCKSSKKKDTSFLMPQAVIDELAQVLEKRKPSLDRPTANAK